MQRWPALSITSRFCALLSRVVFTVEKHSRGATPPRKTRESKLTKGFARTRQNKDGDTEEASLIPEISVYTRNGVSEVCQLSCCYIYSSTYSLFTFSYRFLFQLANTPVFTIYAVLYLFWRSVVLFSVGHV